MRLRDIALVASACLGCGGGGPTADAGPPSDARVADMDARIEADAAIEDDARESADVTTDPAPPPDAPVEPDAELDCSVIGCGPPTICGEACGEPCGCCACAEGMEISADGTTYVCTGGCWAPRGSLGAGEECATTAECGAGLSCCYPCGIPGCTHVCEPTCTGMPGCAGGCLLRP